jgi:hypothetical protein
VCEAELLH